MPQIDARTFAKYAAIPTEFLADLAVECDGSVKRWAMSWPISNAADFAALDPAMTRANGRKADAAGPGRACFERSRGAAKTHDTAALSVWLLAFAARPIKMAAFAADKDQADLLRQSVETLIRLNPWLAEILTVEARRVVNKALRTPAKVPSLASNQAISAQVMASCSTPS